MKKLYSLLLAVVFFFTFFPLNFVPITIGIGIWGFGLAFAQSPAYLWAQRAGGTSDDRAESCTTDSNGNIIVTGYFQSSSITLGTTTLTNDSIGFSDMFIVKYDPEGNVLWAASTGGTYDDKGLSCSTDANGNIIAIGYFQSSSITFGTTTLTNDSIGFSDMFIVKYDPNGNVLWAKSAGGTYNEYGYGCSTDANGNIIATGSFQSSSITFGSNTLTNVDSNTSDMFIVKFDNNGNALWAQCAGGTYSDKGWSCSTDAIGNIITTGYFQSSSITFGTTILTNANTVTADIFIVKYNSNGNILWAQRAGGTSSDYGFSCSTDADGNIIATGYFASSSITFGITTFTNAGGGNSDIFIVKYDLNGNVLWAKNAGGTLSDVGYSCTTDANGDILVTGSFNSASITFGTTTLTSAGGGDVFIVKYDPSGNVLWVKSAGGTSYDYGYCCSTDASGNIIATGYFQSSSLTFGTTTLTNANVGSGDMFIVKLSICVDYSTPICLVTVDSSSTKNVIVWEKPATADIDSFFIYRDTANNAYGLIGKVPYDSLSWFTDTARTLFAANGNPNFSSWRYKLAVKDTCGNISALSDYHQSLFMQNNSGNFNWTDYKIEGQPVPIPSLQNYLFQRDDFSTGNYVTIATLSASSTLFTDPQYSTFQNTATWRVRTAWNISCTPTLKTGTINTTRSNTFKQSIGPGMNENSPENGVRVFPNPNNGKFEITITPTKYEQILRKYEVRIINIFGQEIFKSKINNPESQIFLDAPNGIYFLKVILEERTVLSNKIIIY